jgi:hypothetical protein
MTATPSDWRRADTDAIFDRTGAVTCPGYSAFLGELWSLIAYRPNQPWKSHFPTNRGHGVLVIPAFLTGDASTLPLRRFLAGCGHRVYGWTLGTNWGPTPRILAGLRRRLALLNAQEGGPVSIVGISLGGVLARDLAYDRARDIRQVITVVSPFRLPTASTIAPLVRLCARWHAPHIDFARLATPLPVPTTAIFTRDDGIVAWQSCLSEDQNCHCIEVHGRHLTICRNPETLRAVAVQLSSASLQTP